MKRIAILLAIAACSAPKYEFASTDAGGEPNITNRDSGPSGDDDSGALDAVADASLSSDASPLTETEMASTADFADDCTKFHAGEDLGAAVVAGADAKRHCVIFFHNATWRRTWLEASTMCTSITRAGKPGHLAVFPDASVAVAFGAVNSQFPRNLATWIGLRLADGAPPSSKESWSWVTGDPASGYDGWVNGRPVDGACAAAAGIDPDDDQPHWTDVSCSLTKGVLCEIDE